MELKRNVVTEDEFDTGARMRLNLGHTIGHGVEARSNFTLSHGKAVAIGMAIVSRSAAKMGICSQGCCDRILNILEHFGLPASAGCTAGELYFSALSDKKRAGSTIHLIIPEKIGFCRIQSTGIDELQSFIEAGL